jgi:ribokinase
MTDAMRLFVAANYLTVYCSQVARQPRPGEVLLADGLAVEGGGKGLNVAIGTRRLGAEVSALFGVGHDAGGDALLSLLDAEGLAPTHVHRLHERSGHGFGFIAQDGSNMGAVFAGANLLLTAKHAEQAADAIGAADWVYGQFEAALPALQRCFELARERCVSTVLNPSPWQPIPPGLLALTDVLLVNETEAAALLGLPPLAASIDEALQQLDAAVASLWAIWPGPLLVVTLAERGCVAYRPGQPRIAVPAFAVKAIDTLGAGDAFASGLLCRLTSSDGSVDDLNDALTTALRYACACGAIMASAPGVLRALPTAADVAAFMRDRSAS